MPNIKTSRTKKAPKGWDLIEPTLAELQLKLRDGKFTHMIKQYLSNISQILSNAESYCTA